MSSVNDFYKKNRHANACKCIEVFVSTFISARPIDGPCKKSSVFLIFKLFNDFVVLKICLHTSLSNVPS